MRSLALLLLAGCAAEPTDPPLLLVEDFASGRTRWRDAGSGWKKTEVALAGRSARIAFSGRDPGHGSPAWTDLTWPVDAWPAGATSVEIRARADRPCRVLLKVNLGPTHDDLEMWGRPLELAPDWRRFVIPVRDLTTFLWGHRRSPACDPARIVGIGFAEADFPVTFEIDRIAIR